jgi:hypothetical protein
VWRAIGHTDNTIFQGKIMEKKEQKLSIRDIDIILGIVFFIVFGWTAWQSILMSKERIEKEMATLYTAPGLMPFIISILILICTAYVLIYSFKHGGRIRTTEYPLILKNCVSQKKGRSTLWVFFLVFVYVFFLIGNLPFIPATLIYVLFSLFLFKAGKPFILLIIGTLFSVGVVYFFAQIVGTAFPAGLFF